MNIYDLLLAKMNINTFAYSQQYYTIMYLINMLIAD